MTKRAPSLYQRIPLQGPGGLSRQPILAATRIICHHPSYYAAVHDEFERLWVYPWLLEFLVCEDGIAFTWTRRNDPLIETPKGSEWFDRGEQLWVVDFVRLPDIPILTATRRVSEALLDLGIARDGEVVHIWRHRTCRYGSFVARRGHERDLRQQEGDAADLLHG